MATPPPFVSATQTNWTSTLSATKVTASISVNAGDVLVAVAMSEEFNSTGALTISGGGLVWTKQQEVATASNCVCGISTAIASSTTSFAVTMTRASNSVGACCGVCVYVFRTSDGVGASNKANTSGAPSVSLTTTGDNSTIVCANADWDAVSGSSRTWRTINSITPTAGNLKERVYDLQASQATFYSAYWDDAGAAGSKTAGLSAPTGQQYSTVAVEVKGTAAAASATSIFERSRTIDGITLGGTTFGRTRDEALFVPRRRRFFIPSRPLASIKGRWR